MLTIRYMDGGIVQYTKDELETMVVRDETTGVNPKAGFKDTTIYIPFKVEYGRLN